MQRFYKRDFRYSMNNLMKQILAFTLLSFLMTFPHLSQAASFTVQKIEVEGNHRIGLETIHSYLPLEKGERVDEGKIKQLIESLYQTHFFSDIQVYQAPQNTLLIKVQERPSIAEIKMEGNELISTEDMTSALELIGIKKGRIFNRLTLDRIVLDLKRRYQNQGYYAADVKIDVKPLPRNRVALHLNIVEGKPATIGRITLVGNHAYSDEKIKSKLLLSEHVLIGDGDKYAKPKLQADMETIRSLYMDNGYAKFKILSSQVSLSLDYTQVYITLNMLEEAQYHLSKVVFTGEPVLKPDELEKLVGLKSGDLFSRARIVSAMNRLRDRLSEEGYAFAEVKPLTIFDEAKHQVALDFRIEPKDRVYVRHIQIEDNTRTQDHVIRREMRQYEQAPYSLKDVRHSKSRLERLGYFKKVDIETKRIAKDQVDLVVKVEEQPTGSFTAGVTYSQVDGAGFNLGLSERNLVGTGNQLDLKANFSASTKTLDFGLTDPYFTQSGVSLGYGVFFTEIDAAELGVADYTTNSYGARVNLSYPVSEYSRLNYGLQLQDQELVCASTFSVCNDFIQEYGKHSNSVLLSTGWRYDNKNGFYFPTKGQSTSVNLQVSLPTANKISFYKVYADEKWYFPLTKAFTLKLKGGLAYGDGLNDFKGLPFYEKFYAGGIGSVRGFEPNSLGGTYDYLTDGSSSPKGGRVKAVGTAAIVFPMPFIEDSSNMRFSLFFDAGNVYDEVSQITLDSLRSSAGLSLSWITPVGPLSFSLAKPIGYGSTDQTQTFQFVLGMPL